VAKHVDLYCPHELGYWEPRLNEMPSLRVILHLEKSAWSTSHLLLWTQTFRKRFR